MNSHTSEIEYTGWACSDCACLIANGETPPEMDEDQTKEWLTGIEDRWPNGSIHAALACEEETHIEFSFAPCQYCGSHLGGARCPFVVFVQIADIPQHTHEHKEE